MLRGDLLPGDAFPDLQQCGHAGEVVEFEGTGAAGCLPAGRDLLPGELVLVAAVGEPNPLRPRAFGGKGAEGMKKEIPAMGLVKWGSGNFRQG